LSLSSGVGFIHAEWVKIAQILSEAKGSCWCDVCGRSYIWTRGNRRLVGETIVPIVAGGATSERPAEQRRHHLTEQV
jgi:hypothetical protein